MGQYRRDAAASDARVAIGILRTATQKSSQEGLETVQDSTIKDLMSEANVEIQQKNVDKLTLDQQLVYDIIEVYGEISASDLYEAYREQALNPRSNRMGRNYLNKLSRYNLIEAVGENRGRRTDYWREMSGKRTLPQIGRDMIIDVEPAVG